MYKYRLSLDFLLNSIKALAKDLKDWINMSFK